MVGRVYVCVWGQRQIQVMPDPPPTTGGDGGGDDADAAQLVVRLRDTDDAGPMAPTGAQVPRQL